MVFEQSYGAFAAIRTGADDDPRALGHCRQFLGSLAQIACARRAEGVPCGKRDILPPPSRLYVSIYR